MAQLLTVGLLGDADRNSTWENYLRPHPSVEKVVLTKSVKAVGKVDACIILNESEALQNTYTLMRQGIHCFVVSRLPTDLPMLTRLEHIAEEAGTVLQFANWAYFNPVSLHMQEQVSKPRLLHVTRELSSKTYDSSIKLDHLWIEDLSLILRWINSGVFRIEVQSIATPVKTHTRNTWVQFDNGTTATMFHTLFSSDNRHVRYASDDKMILEANILAKSMKSTFHDVSEDITEFKEFNDELPASQAVNRFLKAIIMKNRSEYGIHDLVRLMRTIAKSNATVSK